MPVKKITYWEQMTPSEKREYEAQGGSMNNDEQGERIKETVKDYHENPLEYSYQDFEEMFEDRDPFEFL